MVVVPIVVVSFQKNRAELDNRDLEKVNMYVEFPIYTKRSTLH